MSLPLPKAVRTVVERAAAAEEERRRKPRIVGYKYRPRCGARAKSTRTPCRARAVWDREHNRPRNGRCKFHGGLKPRKGEGGKARNVLV